MWKYFVISQRTQMPPFVGHVCRNILQATIRWNRISLSSVPYTSIRQINKIIRNWFCLHTLSTQTTVVMTTIRSILIFFFFFWWRGFSQKIQIVQKQQRCQWSPTSHRVVNAGMSPHEFIVVLTVIGTGGCRTVRESCRELNCWVFTVAVAGGSGSSGALVCAVVNRGVCNILLLLLQHRAWWWLGRFHCDDTPILKIYGFVQQACFCPSGAFHFLLMKNKHHLLHNSPQ